MKIRTGFVSNSSSSSFIIDSLKFTIEEVKEKMEVMRELFNLTGKEEGSCVFLEEDYAVFIASEEYEKEMIKEWGEYYNYKDCASKIILNSTKDNSIPYELFDFIENAFDCSRYRLG